MLWIAVLCFCLLRVASVHSMLDARDVPKNSDVDVSLKDKPSVESGARNQGKTKALFARRGLQERQKLRVVKVQKVPAPALPPPARRCSRVMESCIPHTPCCDPCSTCHCRFFNAICYCWRLGRHCQKKS
ncbi:hypothetical protein AGOR_G00172850 [Albula goreensis]|uniref:Agouti domain-containing protein n=2 Tax=Albula TaxID=54908 RepID=A0A8T3D1Z2_9TELE|nr:hypothetical protein JZ751_013539 [Albula glossodonta]KAI1888835.1 hypothetical protein AGOR_G00172850 [Albula goreensis]